MESPEEMLMMESKAAVKSQPERRYDLDWLRVLAVLLLVYFHTAAIFYSGHLGELYVRNELSSREMGLFISFIHQWHMPLFFLLSGTATWFALGYRTGTEYIINRCKRLFIPFLFGTLVLVQPQVYYRLLSAPDYHYSYLQFYPQFFNGIRPQGNFDFSCCTLVTSSHELSTPYFQVLYTYGHVYGIVRYGSKARQRICLRN